MLKVNNLAVNFGGIKAVKGISFKVEKGEIVLLSPASAAFDMFKNFAERGKIFKEIVNKM